MTKPISAQLPRNPFPLSNKQERSQHILNLLEKIYSAQKSNNVETARAYLEVAVEITASAPLDTKISDLVMDAIRKDLERNPR